MLQCPSLGLSTVLNKHVSAGDKILDLGAFARGTSDLFLMKRCTCYFEDLGDYIEMIDIDNSNPKEKLESFVIPKPETTKFDIILAWDLFNYLDLEVIEHIMTLLDPHLKQGTILHTMQYISSTQPAKPRKYRLLEDNQYEVQVPEKEDRAPARGYLILDLLKHMRKFSLSVALVNQEGMHKDVAEYLLEYDKSIAEKKLAKAKNTPVVSYFKQQAKYSNVRMPQLTRAFFTSRRNQDFTIFSCGSQVGEEQSALEKMSKSVYMEDIYSSLCWSKSIAVGSQAQSGTQLLNFSHTVQFDLVLLWDVFNYCDTEQISKIIELLSLHLAPAAKLHLLFFNHKLVADRPARFSLKNDLRVDVMGEVQGKKSNVFPCSSELMRLFPNFKMYGHSYGWFDSRASFSEFLLEYRG